MSDRAEAIAKKIPCEDCMKRGVTVTTKEKNSVAGEEKP